MELVLGGVIAAALELTAIALVLGWRPRRRRTPAGRATPFFPPRRIRHVAPSGR